MLWLIWIAIMLLTPILAGVAVWHQTHAQPHEVLAETLNGHQPGH
jgi:hypothetical protein